MFKTSVVLILITLIFSLSNCFKKATPSNLIYLNHSDTVNYVGISECKNCHFDKFETFKETGMGSSFKPAFLKYSQANFNSIKPIYDSFLNLFYLPFSKDSQIYIMEYRLYENDTIHKRIEKISYIIGSGHHTNSHLIHKKNFLTQAPLTFYTQKGIWDLPPGFENGNNSRFYRKIGLECVTCHNSFSEHEINSENLYQNIPHGISCERCHGPGELHVNSMKIGNPQQLNNTIINPSKLSWSLQIDVCQRCHLQGNAVLKPNKNFKDFRPGMKLSETFEQFSPLYQNEDNLVMAAHSERFQMSQCFIESNLNSKDLKFTCISCHNPHKSVRKTNVLNFNKTCQNCHQKKKCSENEIKIKENENNCVKCHMPSSGSSDIPHVTVHDHYIRKNYKISKSPKKLLGLKSINNKNTDDRTWVSAYVSYYEKFEQNKFYLEKGELYAKNLNNNQIENQIVLIHLYFIKNEFQKVINLVKDNNNYKEAWTCYRIAKSFQSLNKISEAEYWFNKTIEIQPKNIDFIVQYAALLIKNNKYSKAEKILITAKDYHQENSDYFAYLGIIELQKNNLKLSIEFFNKSIYYNPNNQVSLLPLLKIYNQLGKTKEAERIKKLLNIK